MNISPSGKYKFTKHSTEYSNKIIIYRISDNEKIYETESMMYFSYNAIFFVKDGFEYLVYSSSTKHEFINLDTGDIQSVHYASVWNEILISKDCNSMAVSIIGYYSCDYIFFDITNIKDIKLLKSPPIFRHEVKAGHWNIDNTFTTYGEEPDGDSVGYRLWRRTPYDIGSYNFICIIKKMYIYKRLDNKMILVDNKDCMDCAHCEGSKCSCLCKFEIEHIKREIESDKIKCEFLCGRICRNICTRFYDKDDIGTDEYVFVAYNYIDGFYKKCTSDQINKNTAFRMLKYKLLPVTLEDDLSPEVKCCCKDTCNALCSQICDDYITEIRLIDRINKKIYEEECDKAYHEYKNELASD